MMYSVDNAHAAYDDRMQDQRQRDIDEYHAWLDSLECVCGCGMTSRDHKPAKAIAHKPNEEPMIRFTAHKYGQDIEYIAHSITPTRYRSSSPLSVKAHRVTGGVAQVSFENVYPDEILVHTITEADSDCGLFAGTLEFANRAYISAIYIVNNDNQ